MKSPRRKSRSKTTTARQTSDRVSSAAGRIRALRRHHRLGRFYFLYITKGVRIQREVTTDVVACASSAHVQDETKGPRSALGQKPKRKRAGRRK